MPSLYEILDSRRSEVEALERQLRRAFRVKSCARADDCVDMLAADHPFVIEARTKPVFDLSGEAYEHLAWHAMCWVAHRDRETLHYFLPRLMSDWLRRSLQMMDGEMIAEKLAQHPWREWGDEQRRAIEDTLRLIWDTRSRSHESWELTSPICAMAHLDYDLRQIFNDSLQTLEERPALQAWLEDCLDWRRKNFTFGGGFRQGAERRLDELQRYLLSTDFLGKLEQQFYQINDPLASCIISRAHSNLQLIAQHPPAHLLGSRNL